MNELGKDLLKSSVFGLKHGIKENLKSGLKQKSFGEIARGEVLVS